MVPAEHHLLWISLAVSIGVLAVIAIFLIRLRRLQRETQQQKGLLQGVLDSMGEGVCVADEHGKIILINPALQTMTGVAPEHLNSESLIRSRKIFQADGTTPIKEDERPLARAIRGEASDHVEIYWQRGARGWWMSTSSRPIKDANGAIHGAVSVISDITARKHAEEELKVLNTGLEQRVRERTSQLEVANQELEAFSYSVSHDLRSPLRIIDGFSMLLQEGCAEKLDADEMRNIADIRAAAQRMGHIIDDLLALANVTRSQMTYGDIDLSAMAKEVAEDLRKSAPERLVQFIIEPHLMGYGDARLIRIMLENLLGNAFKFTGKQHQARIEFGRTDIGGEVVYFVRDNGSGFDMQFSAKLFEAFERLHSSTEYPGTGIGLATVHRIIQRHGSRVWAEGEPGKGATFYFTLRTA